MSVHSSQRLRVLTGLIEMVPMEKSTLPWYPTSHAELIVSAFLCAHSTLFYGNSSIQRRKVKNDVPRQPRPALQASINKHKLINLAFPLDELHGSILYAQKP
jgi:hypothetical protein